MASLKTIFSHMDIFHPDQSELPRSSSTDILSEVFLFIKQRNSRIRYETVEDIVLRILNTILKKSIPAGDSDTDWYGGEEEAFGQLQQTSDQIESDSDDKIEKEVAEEFEKASSALDDIKSDSESYIEISESELYRMAQDICKCTDEIKRERVIKDKMKRGRVRIKYRPIDDESVVTAEAFDYDKEVGYDEMSVENGSDLLEHFGQQPKYFYGEDNIEAAYDSEYERAIELHSNEEPKDNEPTEAVLEQLQNDEDKTKDENVNVEEDAAEIPKDKENVNQEVTVTNDKVDVAEGKVDGVEDKDDGVEDKVDGVENQVDVIQDNTNEDKVNTGEEINVGTEANETQEQNDGPEVTVTEEANIVQETNIVEEPNLGDEANVNEEEPA